MCIYIYTVIFPKKNPEDLMGFDGIFYIALGKSMGNLWENQILPKLKQ